MNTRTNKTVLLITLMICLATAVYSAVGTFTFRTSGASDTTEVLDLRYPQKVPEDASVTTDSIADGSITNDKLAEPIAIEKGGTGKTTAAEALAALGGASLNGSSTADFAAEDIDTKNVRVTLASCSTIITNVTLANGASIDLNTAIGTTGDAWGVLRIVSSYGYGSGGDFRISGDTSVLVTSFGNASNIDEAAKLCVFPSGTSGKYTIKNNLGAPITFSIIYQGAI